MTKEEAIRRLNRLYEDCCCREDDDWENDADAISLALDSLRNTDHPVKK